jgi:hypothetical protein
MLHEIFLTDSESHSMGSMDSDCPSPLGNIQNGLHIVDSYIPQSSFLSGLESGNDDPSNFFGRDSVSYNIDLISLNFEAESLLESKNEHSNSTAISMELAKKLSKKIQKKVLTKRGSLVIRHKRNCDRDFDESENPQLKPSMVTFRRSRGKPLELSSKKMYLSVLGGSKKDEAPVGSEDQRQSVGESCEGSDITFDQTRGSQNTQEDLMNQFLSLKVSNQASVTEAAENLSVLQTLTSTIQYLGLLSRQPSISESNSCYFTGSD